MSGRTVAVIGVGVMGSAFTGHLLADQHRVLVHDISPARRAAAASIGATVLDGLEDPRLVEAGVVVLSLPSDGALSSVSTALGTLRWGSDTVVVETSTLTPAVKEQARRLLAGAGVVLVDCPVSGTGAQAAVRDLVVYASGDADALRRCADVLGSIADTILEVGPFGAGMRIKLLANHLVVVHTVVAAEVLAAAREWDLDLELVHRALCAGAGTSRMLELRGGPMVRREYPLTCALSVLRKDVDLIQSTEVPPPAGTALLDAAAQIFRRADALGLSDQDAAAVHELYVEPRSTT